MKKFSVLIIDDNAVNSTSLQEILVVNDYDVKTIKSDQIGLQLLADETFDLVFIEAELPGKDSFALCREIKSSAVLEGTPVIFVVPLNDFVGLKDIYESGGDDYIIRPPIWGELLMKARIHLELRYSRIMAKSMNKMLESKVFQRTFELEDSLKKLRQAKKELEILEIAKSEFLNLISHEIRTPLNGILGSMALIGRYNFSDEVNRYFSLLDTSVKRLEKFSNTILEAANLRIKGAKALKFAETDLVKVISNSLDQCADKFRNKEIEVDLQNNTTGSIVLGDQKYLMDCFTAVLDNAFKFSPKGDKIGVRIANSSDGFLIISITDHGNGFSKGSLENIYNPLSNLEAHFDQNTGMGLHLAKLIIDAHSGFIKVGNHEPSGAVIEILIPTI
jgi:two-component system, sensor histidine kinase and response regulator